MKFQEQTAKQYSAQQKQLRKEKPLYIEKAIKFDKDQEQEAREAKEQIGRKERVQLQSIKSRMRAVDDARQEQLDRIK